MRTFRTSAIILTLCVAVAGGVAQLAAVDEPTASESAEVFEVAVVPRGPLALGETGTVPADSTPWIWWLAALGPAAVLWVGLAARKAHVGDGTYERRRARVALRRFVKRLVRRGGEPSTADLERWCALTAAMMGVARAAPAATDIGRALGTMSGAPDQPMWFTLWLEARQSIYAAQRTLPKDWVARALSAIDHTRVLRAASPWPTRRAHWLPVLAVAMFAAVVPGANRAVAAEAAQAYSAGEYARARALWQESLAENPSDWAAHTNLGLTYAQEEAWGGAAAHWTAAYLQAPRHEIVASNVRLGLAHIDGVDPALRNVISGAWYDRFFGRFSPAEWQMATRFAAVLFCLGLCGQIAAFYRAGVVVRRTARGLIVVGLLGGVTSVVAVHRYGILANPAVACIIRATDLRSVPSDLVEQQQMAPLLPGRLVIVDGTYFGWLRIQVGTETVGWVRRGMVLPLYVAPSTQSASGIDPSAPRPPTAEPSASDQRAG